MAEVEDPVELLKRAMSIHLKFAKKTRGAVKVMRNEAVNLSAAGKKRVSKAVDELVEAYRAIIEYGIWKGAFKNVDTRVAAEFLIHSCTICFDYGDLPYQKIPLDAFSKFVVDNFVGAMMNPDAGKAARKAGAGLPKSK